MSGFAELDAHPDSGPAMGRAVQGARVIVLANAGVAVTCKLLERARLDAFVEAVVSADDAGAWKPAADAYLHAAEVAGVPPERLALVSEGACCALRLVAIGRPDAATAEPPLVGR